MEGMEGLKPAWGLHPPRQRPGKRDMEGRCTWPNPVNSGGPLTSACIARIPYGRPTT